jgi:hypothetical protein
MFFWNASLPTLNAIVAFRTPEVRMRDTSVLIRDAPIPRRDRKGADRRRGCPLREIAAW